MQDLQLGKGRVALAPVTTAALAPLILPSDNRRVAILITWSGGFVFDTTAPGVIADQMELFARETNTGTPFLRGSGSFGPMVLKIEELGNLITGPISAAVVNATGQGQLILQPIIWTGEAKPAFSKADLQ